MFPELAVCSRIDLVVDLAQCQVGAEGAVQKSVGNHVTLK